MNAFPLPLVGDARVRLFVLLTLSVSVSASLLEREALPASVKPTTRFRSTRMLENKTHRLISTLFVFT